MAKYYIEDDQNPEDYVTIDDLTGDDISDIENNEVIEKDIPGSGTIPPPPPPPPEDDIPGDVIDDEEEEKPPIEPIPQDPYVTLIDPYTIPAGWEEARYVDDVYEIVPVVGEVPYKAYYEVGGTTSQGRTMIVRNKCKDNYLRVGMVLPEFWNLVPFPGVQGYNVEAVNGVVDMLLPPRSQARFRLYINQRAGLNIAMRRDYIETQDLKLLIQIKEVTGPVFFKLWDDNTLSLN